MHPSCLSCTVDGSWQRGPARFQPPGPWHEEVGLPMHVPAYRIAPAGAAVKCALFAGSLPGVYRTFISCDPYGVHRATVYPGTVGA